MLYLNNQNWGEAYPVTGDVVTSQATNELQSLEADQSSVGHDFFSGMTTKKTS